MSLSEIDAAIAATRRELQLAVNVDERAELYAFLTALEVEREERS